MTTDASERDVELLALVAKAKENTPGFLGETKPDATHILCTTDACANTFNLRTRGLALAIHRVLIGPEGVNEIIPTHETVHLDLHSSAQFCAVKRSVAPKVPRMV